MTDKLAEFVCKRFGRLESDRRIWHNEWQDIVRFVRPTAMDFDEKRSPGEARTKDIFDGTAMHALAKYGSGLHSFVTHPSERWFSVEFQGVEPEQLDRDSLVWLAIVNDLIYSVYQQPVANQSMALHECYLDLGSFGTAVVSQEWNSRFHMPVFSAEPLASCFLLENDIGLVDTVFRERKMTLRQMMQKFGELPPELAKVYRKNEDEEKTVIHAVYPRTDRNPVGLGPRNKPFASVWVCKETKETLKEGGYDSMPYHVVRWEKMAAETYGRGPAKKCLPDIRMLQRSEMMMIKATQKAVDPPIFVPDDAFMLPPRMSPGGVNYMNMSEPGKNIFMPPFAGNIPIGYETSEQKRRFIEACFFADLWDLEKKNVEMTALEVAERRNNKLQELAPMMGRIERELLTPMIARTFSLLESAGKIPPYTGRVDAPIRVTYNSPASKAQKSMKNVDTDNYIQGLIPLAQIQPNIIDVINFDAVAQQRAITTQIDPRILRSPEEVAAMRQEREQAEQAQNMLAAAEPASKALKNVADAQAAGGLPEVVL